MYEKLDKLRDEVRRAEKRKKAADERLKTAQEKLREAENLQILSDVGALNMTPEQVAQFLKMAASGKLPKVNPDGSIVQEDAGYPKEDVGHSANGAAGSSMAGEQNEDSEESPKNPFDNTVPDVEDENDFENEKGEDSYV